LKKPKIEIKNDLGTTQILIDQLDLEVLACGRNRQYRTTGVELSSLADLTFMSGLTGRHQPATGHLTLKGDVRELAGLELLRHASSVLLKLAEFGERVLWIMQSHDEWNSDTTDMIYVATHDLGLEGEPLSDGTFQHAVRYRNVYYCPACQRDWEAQDCYTDHEDECDECHTPYEPVYSIKTLNRPTKKQHD